MKERRWQDGEKQREKLEDEQIWRASCEEAERKDEQERDRER
jgi:hypothetical protein